MSTTAQLVKKAAELLKRDAVIITGAEIDSSGVMQRVQLYFWSENQAVMDIVTKDDLVQNWPDTGVYSFLPQQAADYLKGHYIVSQKIKNFLEIDCEFDTCRKIEGRTRSQSTLDFHSLRHTFCSIAGIVGIPLVVVQSIVGHMTKRMTELYSRHVEEQERLRWIRLFGERLKSLPNLPVAQIETDDDRDRAVVIEAVKKADMETVRKILAMLRETA